MILSERDARGPEDHDQHVPLAGDVVEIGLRVDDRLGFEREAAFAADADDRDNTQPICCIAPTLAIGVSAGVARDV